jgi:photosystem II stability/assembly factor-like uncharacterized protein
MKKITIYFFVFFTAVVNAQLNFEATEEFGTIENIIFDPTERDKLYAATRGNHIIQSYDKGESWEILYSFPESIAWVKNLRYMSDLHALSFNIEYSLIRQNVYIFDLTTSEIVKEYVIPIPMDSQEQQVFDYDIDQSNPDIVVVNQRYKIGFASYCKVYYSNNGGNSWNEIYYTPDFEGIFPSVTRFSPNNSEKIYLTRSNGLFISEDAGQTWELKMEDVSLHALVFHPNDPNYLLMGTSIEPSQDQTLFRSLDGGENWEIIPIEWTPDGVNLFISINFNPDNPDNILILESNEIVITNDGGDTWTHYVYPMWQMDEYMFGTHASFNPFEPNEVFINADHHPMFSTDGGATLEFVRMPFYRVNSVFLNHNSDDPHLYYTARNGIIHRDMSTGQDSPYHIESIFDFNDYTELVAYANPYVSGQVFSYKINAFQSVFQISNNHGETFTGTHIGEWDVIVDFKVNPHNPNQIWIAFLYNGIKVYNIENQNNIIVTEVVVPNEDIVTWIYFEPSNPGEIIITDGITVRKTLNYGLSWEDMSNGIVLDPLDIIYHIDRNPFNPDHMIITTNVDMYMTLDGGENWEPVYEGRVREAKFSKSVNGHVIAAIYSYGHNTAKLLTSNNGGQSWNEIPRSVLEYANSYTMDYIFEDSTVTVYMSTVDMGLITYEYDFNTLGTPDIPNIQGSFVFYPNPAKDVITLSVANENAKTISIFSSTGELVLQTDYRQTLDVSSLSSGVYFIRIATENNHNLVKKLIKK